MVEILTTEAAWFEGNPVEPGTVVSVSEADAAYLVGIGRATRVEAGEAEEGQGA